MALRNYNVDSAVALTANRTGTAVSVDKNKNGFCVGVVISGSSSPSGTLKLQACIDTGGTPTNWCDVGASISVTADGNHLFQVAQGHNYKWVRTNYAFTGGSANMTTTFNENEG